MKIKYAHLSAGFMLTSIIGFLVSVFLIGKYSDTWAFTFGLFFMIMLVASIISMTNADYHDIAYEKELAIHEKIAKKQWKK